MQTAENAAQLSSAAESVQKFAAFGKRACDCLLTAVVALVGCLVFALLADSSLQSSDAKVLSWGLISGCLSIISLAVAIAGFFSRKAVKHEADQNILGPICKLLVCTSGSMSGMVYAQASNGATYRIPDMDSRGAQYAIQGFALVDWKVPLEYFEG